MLLEARHHGVERAVNDTLRWQRVLPGFGHAVYKRGDARFDVLSGLFEELAPPEDVELVHSLVELAADHAIPLPNVDLALAAMALATGMPPDAGRTIFTVARVAGWTAHYLEELDERPLRYRARAVYASPGRDPGAGADPRMHAGGPGRRHLRSGDEPARPPSRPDLPGDREPRPASAPRSPGCWPPGASA